jgi:hypothetical protein
MRLINIYMTQIYLIHKFLELKDSHKKGFRYYANFANKLLRLDCILLCSIYIDVHSIYFTFFFPTKSDLQGKVKYRNAQFYSIDNCPFSY